MKKQHTLLCLLLAVLIAGGLLYLGRDPESPARVPKIPPIAERPPGSREPSQLGKAKGPAPSGLLPKVTMQPVSGEPDAGVRYRYQLDVPFRFRGDGTSGRVVDREGKVLMESGEEIHIWGAALSPDDSLVLVKGGPGSIVFNPATGEKIPLPQKPPGEHMLGLGSWHWMGTEILVANGGDNALDERGQPVKHEANVGQSRLYTYDLRRRELSEVVLPVNIPVPVFVIKEASYDGHVHLILDSEPEGINPDLGWFKIEAPK